MTLKKGYVLITIFWAIVRQKAGLKIGSPNPYKIMGCGCFCGFGTGSGERFRAYAWVVTGYRAFEIFLKNLFEIQFSLKKLDWYIRKVPFYCFVLLATDPDQIQEGG